MRRILHPGQHGGSNDNWNTAVNADDDGQDNWTAYRR